jgi:hypothetical protein
MDERLEVTEVADPPAGQGPWVVYCLVERCGFVSSGWASEEDAAKRGAEHLAEHDEPAAEVPLDGAGPAPGGET